MNNNPSCHLLLGGANRRLSDLKLDDLASVRLRSYPAGQALSDAGWIVSTGDHVPKDVNTVIVGKIPIFDLEQRAPHWIRELERVKRRGSKVILDYTDHHLGFDSPIKPFYRKAFEMADRCIVSHAGLSVALRDHDATESFDVKIIEDLIEHQFCEPREPSDDPTEWGVIWFGHGTNFEFLARLCASWPDKAPKNLYIVSSEEVHNFIRSGQLHASVPLQLHFREWSQTALAEVAAVADIAIIPSSFESRKRFASSNRLVTSLALGLPVVATPLPSYQEFEDYFFELGSVSARMVFENPGVGHDQVKRFQSQLGNRFSLASVKDAWLTNISTV